jgi:hypothetical protein
VVLFARDISDPNQSNVFEMQTLWFENESGEAYAALGDHGRALKVRSQFQPTNQLANICTDTLLCIQ